MLLSDCYKAIMFAQGLKDGRLTMDSDQVAVDNNIFLVHVTAHSLNWEDAWGYLEKIPRFENWYLQALQRYNLTREQCLGVGDAMQGYWDHVKENEELLQTIVKYKEEHLPPNRPFSGTTIMALTAEPSQPFFSHGSLVMEYLRSFMGFGCN